MCSLLSSRHLDPPPAASHVPATLRALKAFELTAPDEINVDLSIIILLHTSYNSKEYLPDQKTPCSGKGGL